MHQHLAPERCSIKFCEAYHLEEGEIVTRFLQVNMRKDPSHTFRTAAASRECERERERWRERARERERDAGTGGTCCGSSMKERLLDHLWVDRGFMAGENWCARKTGEV